MVAGTTLQTVLQAFTQRLMMARPDGRPLDIQDVSEVIRGETSPIEVDRDDLLPSTFLELLSADGREYDPLDIRIPLEVSFFGEGRSNILI